MRKEIKGYITTAKKHVGKYIMGGLVILGLYHAYIQNKYYQEINTCDIENDGDKDAIVSVRKPGEFETRIDAIINHGLWYSRREITTKHNIFDLTAITRDVNNDDLCDIVLFPEYGRISTLYNKGEGKF
jgi:hypothetical protein